MLYNIADNSVLIGSDVNEVYYFTDKATDKFLTDDATGLNQNLYAAVCIIKKGTTYRSPSKFRPHVRTSEPQHGFIFVLESQTFHIGYQ